MAISFFYPKHVKDSLRRLIMYADMKVSPERLITLMLFSSAFLALIVTPLFLSFSAMSLVLAFASAFIIINVFIYAFLTIKADARARFFEETLPDALDLTASNLRAGMTPERALLLASRPEFGPLQDEIERVGKDIALGKSLPEALARISRRVMSESVENVISLISSGVKSGGGLAELLAEASKSMKTNEMIEKRVRSVVSVYVIFVFTAIAIGAPFLFATSTFLIEALGSIMEGIEIPASAGIPVIISASGISPEAIIPLVIILMAVTCIMASLVVGEISKGKARYGFRYMPALAAASIAMFYIFRWAIAMLIGGAF